MRRLRIYAFLLPSSSEEGSGVVAMRRIVRVAIN